MATPDSDAIAHAAELIAQSDALIVAAGAGMGVDSGLPDFRGTQGFWQAYPALGKDQVQFNQIASPGTFRTQPERAWGFYGHRLNLYRSTVPHPGFEILRRWGQARHRGVSVFTSNVDGQFQTAAYDPAAVYECHGNLHHLQCLQCCTDAIWSAHGIDPVVDEERCVLVSPLPKCPHCGCLARPNVLMFSDYEWLEHRAVQQLHRLDAWLAGVRRPVVVEIGAGTAIPSVRHFSHRVMRQHGGRLIRINLRESDVPTPFDVGLGAGALATLQAIDQALGAGTFT